MFWKFHVKRVTDNIVLSLIVEKNKKEEVNLPGTADKTAGFV